MADLYGEIVQVIGPVVDINFSSSGAGFPNIHDALEIKREDNSILVSGDAPIETLVDIIEGFTVDFEKIDYQAILEKINLFLRSK